MAKTKAISATKSTKKTTQRATQKATIKGTTKSGGETGGDFFGLELKTWVQAARLVKASDLKSGKRGFVFYLGRRPLKPQLSLFRTHLQPWQMEALQKSESDILHFHGKQGPVWILRPQVSSPNPQHEGLLERSVYTRARDQFGSLVNSLSTFDLQKLVIEFHNSSPEEEKAAFVGLEIGRYFYSENRDNPRKARRKLPALFVRADRTQINKADIQNAGQLGLALNMARHLTNLPGGDLQPGTYANAVAALFADFDSVKVDVWEGDKLAQERMNMMIAVGQAAAQGPRMVHLRYRPKNVEGKVPVAIVGKGITFDTGGLDVKPFAAMRWMKKDMGGSAAVVALCYWTAQTGLEQPLDCYLALAENSIDRNAFRPGDVITARNGITVEIHSTDAEGRLVLGDVMDVAANQAEKPQALIDVATLTGAIKVALGADIAGLFSNHDGLANMIQDSGRRTGDLNWRMPLFQPYRPLFRSTFADCANSADGFAGAITAALFLESFAGKLPWAHLDVYAWRDSAGGAWSESGGNGQPFQALADVVSKFAASSTPLTPT